MMKGKIMDTGGVFYSKILLFGEYALMKGSKALSIPFSEYYGKFTYAAGTKVVHKGFNPKEHLKRFLDFLKSLDRGKKHLTGLDLNSFENDLNRGMTVDSNIPLGYGLGSSGALVAAIYDRYAMKKIEPSANLPAASMEKLRKIFSTMESFFHGVSSGFDPLTCYLNRPVLRDENGILKTVPLPRFDRKGTGALFLLDTGTVGETRPLVEYFMNRCNDDLFDKFLKSELIPLNERSIHLFLKGDAEGLWSVVKLLSALTFREFLPMIPQSVHSVWQEGLNSGDYALKLCGSGGGGMMLGFTADFSKVEKKITEFKIIKVMTL